MKKSLPHGQVTVKVVKGGLDVPDDERDDTAVIATAAIAVRLDLPCTMAETNRQWRLASYPEGMPKESDWTLSEGAIPEPGPGRDPRARHLSRRRALHARAHQPAEELRRGREAGRRDARRGHRRGRAVQPPRLPGGRRGRQRLLLRVAGLCGAASRGRAPRRSGSRAAALLAGLSRPERHHHVLRAARCGRRRHQGGRYRARVRGRRLGRADRRPDREAVRLPRDRRHELGREARLVPRAGLRRRHRLQGGAGPRCGDGAGSVPRASMSSSTTRPAPSTTP